MSWTMLGMHVNGHHRCPDCGATVWVPIALEPVPGRRPELRVRVREEAFQDAFERHVMLNPDLHPSFTTGAE